MKNTNMFCIPLEKYFIKTSNIINYSNKWEGKKYSTRASRNKKVTESHAQAFYVICFNDTRTCFFHIVFSLNNAFLGKEICADVKHELLIAFLFILKEE